MNKNKVLLISFLILAFIVFSVQAQEMKKIGQAGMQFMKIETGARAAAMGGAMTLTVDDANAVFYNPAGLSWMTKKADIAGNTTQWIADIQYHSISGAYSFDDIGTFALFGLFSDYGDIEGTVLAENDAGYLSTGNIDVSSYAVGLSYARNIANNFSIGATIKYLSQGLGKSIMNDDTEKENNVTGVGFDFGTIFYPGWESFRFGISVKNFGPEFEYEQESFESPLTFTIGVAMNVMDLFDMRDEHLLLSFDAEHPRDYTERVKFGAEYILLKMFALRAGYKTNHDVEGFSGGVGFLLDLSGVGLRIDYAYSDIQYFDAVHRVSVGFSF